MSIQSIIGGQALALNVLRRIPPIFQRDVRLRPLLDSALRNGDAERTVHQQDAVDGLPRRHRGRTACLRKSGLDSQTYTTYRWTTPGDRPAPDLTSEPLIRSQRPRRPARRRAPDRGTRRKSKNTTAYSHALGSYVYVMDYAEYIRLFIILFIRAIHIHRCVDAMRFVCVSVCTIPPPENCYGVVEILEAWRPAPTLRSTCDDYTVNMSRSAPCVLCGVRGAGKLRTEKTSTSPL